MDRDILRQANASRQWVECDLLQGMNIWQKGGLRTKGLLHYPQFHMGKYKIYRVGRA